jgi:hypothetical protein
MTKTKRNFTLMLLINKSLYIKVSKMNWRSRKNLWKSNNWKIKKHKIKEMNELRRYFSEKKNSNLFNNDDSDDDKITLFMQDVLSVRNVLMIAESITCSSIFKLTKAKRARINTTTAYTIIIELADAVKIALQAHTTTFIITFIN